MPGPRVPWAFEVAYLDGFLARLAVDARPVAEVGGPIQSLVQAGRSVSEPPTFLTRLIVEGRLARVGRRAGMRGWNALLDDVDEVRHVVHPPVDGVSRKQLPGLLGLRTGTVRALVDGGAFRTTGMAIHGGRVAVDRIDPDDVDRFRADHVRVRAFCREIGTSLHEVKRMISGASVEPAFPVDAYGACIYRRADLRTAGSAWRERPPEPP